jgi:hypothetical protein
MKNSQTIIYKNVKRELNKILLEQSVIGAPYRGVIDNKDVWTPQEEKNILKYKCIPIFYRNPTANFINKGYNKKLLKATLGIIGRESSFGGSLRFFAKNLLKLFGYKIGSYGPAQIKKRTAAQFGVKDVTTIDGAIDAAYKYLNSNYQIAIKMGYSTNTPSSNYKNGTGDAALDIAIVAYNSGASIIKKWCETTDPKIKRDCKLAGKHAIIDLPGGSKKKVKVLNKPAQNYLPYLTTNRADTGLQTSWGYVKTVAGWMKKFNCF